MPKRLRRKSRRQPRGVAPLAQARWAAHSHPCKQSKRTFKSCQGRRSHQNTVLRVAKQQQAVNTSSTSYRTYRNSEELRSRIASEIITPLQEPWDKASVSSPRREFPPATAREVDPLRIHPQHPHISRPPSW